MCAHKAKSAKVAQYPVTDNTSFGSPHGAARTTIEPKATESLVGRRGDAAGLLSCAMILIAMSATFDDL
jgi:hypothetical protein